MKNLQTVRPLAASLLAGASLVALGAPPAHALGAGPGTIVDVAVADGNFTILVQALQATGLDQTLGGAGPFTVFAPDDEAFNALGQATIDALLNDIPTLTKILEYHVVVGNVPSGQVTATTFLTTVADQRVDISTDGVDFFVDQARLTALDIPASNGVIHELDAVLQPNLRTVFETAQDAGTFTTLELAVTTAGLDGALNGPGPFTVFAPDDAAFALLPPTGLQSLVTNQVPLLTLILQYHVVPGRLYADEVVKMSELTTLLGAKLKVRVVGNDVFVNNSRISAVDIEAVNGNVHVLESVLGAERVF
jgi:uncharacterized surface protein with fasciclin (FAS1) repeats